MSEPQGSLTDAEKLESAEPEAAKEEALRQAELTSQERVQLDEAEAIIASRLLSFREVGNALMAIQNGRLYRQSGTFEEYLMDRWDMERSTGYQYIAATKAMDNLSPVDGHLPINECQVRPLTKLTPEKQQMAWERASKTAPNGKVTGKHVKKVVEEMTAPEPRPEDNDLNLAGPFVNRFVHGDWAEVIPTLSASSCDLLLMMNLPGSSPASAAENLAKILSAVQSTMKADHQALVLCRFPDSRALVAAAEQAGYESGLPFIWTSDRERTVIPWSARSNEYHILHLRRGCAVMHQPVANVIECPEESFKDDPDQKPLKLVELLVEAAIPPGGVISVNLTWR